MSRKRYVTIFSRFERFWHWAQAILVLLLLVTGARRHGLFEVSAWAMATFVLIHDYMATTGETVGAYLKAKITGREWVEVPDEDICST